MTNISITNSKNNVGAYINDIDLQKLDQSKAEEIKKALNQFGVIFIKKQRFRSLSLIKTLQNLLANLLFIQD